MCITFAKQRCKKETYDEKHIGDEKDLGKVRHLKKLYVDKV